MFLLRKALFSQNQIVVITKTGVEELYDSNHEPLDHQSL